MDLKDINLKNFFEKVTYSSDASPGGRMVISNGMFVQCIINLKLINVVEKLRRSLRK